MFNPPKKSLGQNFLNDENIQRKIVSLLDLDEGINRIIEIGPGRGALTNHLINLGIPLTLVEYDKDLFTYWDSVSDGKFQVIHSDILDVDFNRHFPGEKMAVIGNIPYNITTPILFKLIEYKHLVHHSVIMMQKEVAYRLTASPNSKNYGILSIMHQLHTQTSLAFNVSKNVFFPKPKVESTVIKCVYAQDLIFKIDNITLFNNIVRSSFQQRRKMIRSSLKHLLEGCDTAILQEYLEKRPENLSIENFADLTSKIERLKMQL